MIEKAKENIEWVKKNGNTIGSLLDNYMNPKSVISAAPSLQFATILPLITVSVALLI